LGRETEVDLEKKIKTVERKDFDPEKEPRAKMGCLGYRNRFRLRGNGNINNENAITNGKALL